MAQITAARPLERRFPQLEQALGLADALEGEVLARLCWSNVETPGRDPDLRPRAEVLAGSLS